VVTSLQIQLEVPRQPGGSSPARCTLTAASVRLLDAHTIVCCSSLSCKIWQIRFDLGFCQYTLVDSEDTVCENAPVETALCDIDGRGHVIASNGEDGRMRLYGIDRGKIWHDRDLSTVLLGNFCPTVRFCGPDVVVVAAAALGPPRGLHFFDVMTMRSLLHVKTERPPKDVCFLPGNRAVLIMVGDSPASGRSDTEIQLIEYDLGQQTWDVIDQQSCAAIGPASVAFYEGRLYVADSQGGRILVLDARTLRQVDQLDGYDVPHGVDARYGILAVACHGSCSIHVRPIRWAR
jgi:hypothetical protein